MPKDSQETQILEVGGGESRSFSSYWNLCVKIDLSFKGVEVSGTWKYFRVSKTYLRYGIYKVYLRFSECLFVFKFISSQIHGNPDGKYYVGPTSMLRAVSDHYRGTRYRKAFPKLSIYFYFLFTVLKFSQNSQCYFNFYFIILKYPGKNKGFL